MSSLIASINQYICIEYIYGGGDTFDTNQQKIKIIKNAYNNERTIVNDTLYQRKKTGNIVDNSGVPVSDGSYVHLDRDGKDYTLEDQSVTIENAVFPVTRNVDYETVKIHILAGYNFQDSLGFALNIVAPLMSGKQANLCSFIYTREDLDNIYTSTKPLKLSDRIYDKYVMLKIPAMSWLLEEQFNNSDPDNTFTKVCFGEFLKIQNLFYAEFRIIDTDYYTNGYRFFNVSDLKQIIIDTDDRNNELGADITEYESYFSLKPLWNGEGIEDYIYRLNSLAGNNYVIVHDISVVEQYGSLFIKTANHSFVQSEDFSEPYDFRPILKNRDGSASSFSIDYVVRLLNRVDGRSIFAEGSVSSNNVGTYGRNMLKLNVGNVNEPFQVYNRIVKQEAKIIDSTNSLIQNRITAYFVDKATIQFKINSTDTEGGQVLKFSPFISILSFEVTDKDGNKKDVSYLNNPAISIMKDAVNKVYIPEFIDPNFDKTKGTIAFKMTPLIYNQLKNLETKKYYLINRAINGEESLLYTGTFEIL